VSHPPSPNLSRTPFEQRLSSQNGQERATVREEPAVMPKWEYEKIDLSDTPRRGDEIDLLDTLGEEGWELVAITQKHVAYLKRQVARKRGPAVTTEYDREETSSS
jgi:hypothetical protein